MTPKEKEVLKALVEHPSGLLSPSDFINGIAKRDRRAVENLIIGGYVEEVPQDIHGTVPGTTYSRNFYRATNKRAMQFAPFYTKVLFNLKNETTFYVGITSVVVSIVALFSTVSFSYLQNKRANADFELRNRPYLVISSTDSSNIVPEKSADFALHIKNVGIFPAQVIDALIACPKDDQITLTARKMIIGNGEEMFFEFSIPSGLNSVSCKFLVNYTIAAESFAKKSYSTEYIFSFKNDSMPIYESAFIR